MEDTMLQMYSNVRVEMQERSDTLETVRRQLAQRENDLRTLQAQYQALLDEFTAEHKRAQRLSELSERFGLR
jgi:hypothetical protein